MPLVETESIVLRSYNLAEADRIAVFFTRDHGIVRGVAKGAKRLKSRFGSTIEPFSTVEVSYFQKEERELVAIQAVEMVRSRFDSAADPAFLEAFSYIVDLLLKLLPPDDPNEVMYRMLKACLNAEPSGAAQLEAIKVYFELWILRLGGYLPDWSRCEGCGREFLDNEAASLRGSSQLQCRLCQKGGGVKQVAAPVRELYCRIQTAAPVDFIANAEAISDSLRDLSAILRRILDHVIGPEVSRPKVAVPASKNAV